MNKFEFVNEIEKLAKEKYGEYYLAALWGSAQSFLTEDNLKIMESVMKGKQQVLM